MPIARQTPRNDTAPTKVITIGTASQRPLRLYSCRGYKAKPRFDGFHAAIGQETVLVAPAAVLWKIAAALQYQGTAQVMQRHLRRLVVADLQLALCRAGVRWHLPGVQPALVLGLVGKFPGQSLLVCLKELLEDLRSTVAEV